MSSSTHILYFNGLGSGQTRTREQWVMRFLAKRGIEVTHAPINWRSDESFQDLFARMLKRTKQELKKHGQLVLVGSSAGGSLAVSILAQLHDPNLRVVTLCSRLHPAKLPWWDWRSLKHMAYLGKKHQSQSFFDAVSYCGNVAIPKLTKQDKQRITIVQQWADDVVPRATMGIPGVRTYRVLAFGHGPGIILGALRLPKILEL
jgi:pimeloyl-ACP methyl ester carboxylesterase